MGVEGFVIRFEDGNMLKIKTIWYFDVNHALDDIKNPNERHKWECILGGTVNKSFKYTEKYDDIRVHLTPDERESMDNFAKDLLIHINKTAKRIYDSIVELKKQNLDRKQFAQIANKYFILQCC